MQDSARARFCLSGATALARAFHISFLWSESFAAVAQVLWLDLTAAKARYGRWIGGELPTFAEFARTTKVDLCLISFDPQWQEVHHFRA